jgi:hypothetical protein
MIRAGDVDKAFFLSTRFQVSPEQRVIVKV